MAATKRKKEEKERDVRHIQERPKRLIQQRLCRLLDRFLSPSLYGCSTVIILPSPPELALFFFFGISFPQPSPSQAPSAVLLSYLEQQYRGRHTGGEKGGGDDFIVHHNASLEVGPRRKRCGVGIRTLKRLPIIHKIMIAAIETTILDYKHIISPGL